MRTELRVMSEIHVTKDLKEKDRQLQEKKIFVFVKKRKKESKQSSKAIGQNVGVGVVMMLLRQTMTYIKILHMVRRLH